MSKDQSQEVAADQVATTGLTDDRLIAVMRLLLASSGLIVIVIDPAEPNRFVTLTYTVLVLYTLYSALIHLTGLWRRRALRDWEHWVDIGWYSLLISLSSGTHSVFFFGFFFAILVASFRWGLASGLRMTIVSAVIFTTIGYATTPVEQGVELNRFLMRPASLLVLGYMISRWGGFEIELNRRLMLLKDISILSNPRFGIDWTIGAILERLLVFYRADACLLILANESDGEKAKIELRRATAENPAAGRQVVSISGEMADRMLGPPTGGVIVYPERRTRLSLGRRLLSGRGADPGTDETTAGDSGRIDAGSLAALIDAESFISLPLQYYHQTRGRLFVTRRHGFDPSEVEFLHQISEHIKPVIDNIRLVDQLASSAAEEERRRIARDLHDSVVQPYIGFQMGLAAVGQRLGDGAARHEIERLMALTESGILGLRHYIANLKATQEEANSLALALQRFAARFTETTGIAVQVEANIDLPLNDRLAAELFQMAVEGLSNVRRHTRSPNAWIRFAFEDDHATLRIENDGLGETAFATFTPRSIKERAEALGGSVKVVQSGEGRTTVAVGIPL